VIPPLLYFPCANNKKEGTTPRRIRMAQVGTLVAGGLVAIGGLIGYLKAGSVPSLVAGVVVGALYGLSTLHMEPDQTLGNAAAVLVSIVLSIQMGKRYLASQKAMAGIHPSFLAVATPRTPPNPNLPPLLLLQRRGCRYGRVNRSPQRHCTLSQALLERGW